MEDGLADHDSMLHGWHQSVSSQGRLLPESREVASDRFQVYGT